MAAALAAVALAVMCGCGGSDPRTRASPPPSSPGSEGRPLGAPHSDPGAGAVAAATRFVRGFLAFQAGRLAPDQVPAATRELRASLKRLRVPPASRARHTRILSAQLQRIDARSARVTVQIRNIDEQLTYPLPIDLVRRDKRWAALSAGDDT